MLNRAISRLSAGRARPLAAIAEVERLYAQELGAVAAKGAIERSGIDAKEFDHAVFGNAQQTSVTRCMGAARGLRRAAD